MGLECILVPGICVRLSPVRPGFVGPAGLCRAGRVSSGPARTPKARLFRPGRARAGSDRLLHESGRNSLVVRQPAYSNGDTGSAAGSGSEFF